MQQYTMFDKLIGPRRYFFVIRRACQSASAILPAHIRRFQRPWCDANCDHRIVLTLTSSECLVRWAWNHIRTHQKFSWPAWPDSSRGHLCLRGTRSLARWKKLSTAPRQWDQCAKAKRVQHVGLVTIPRRTFQRRRRARYGAETSPMRRMCLSYSSLHLIREIINLVLVKCQLI